MFKKLLPLLVVLSLSWSAVAAPSRDADEGFGRFWQRLKTAVVHIFDDLPVVPHP